MLWLYNLPLWVLGPLMLAVFVGAAVLLQLVTRKWVQRNVHTSLEDHNEAVSALIGVYGLFYGITLGLIAVATWENYEETEQLVNRECSSLVALIRNVTGFPQPTRNQFLTAIRQYNDVLIDEEWPQLHRGRIPTGGMESLDQVQTHLLDFEPTTLRESALFQEALREFNTMIEYRRTRLSRLEASLPALLWWVVLFGAVLNLMMTYALRITPLRTHLWLTALVAAFIGLLVFLITAMDRPFLVEFSVEPDAFRHLRDALIARGIGQNG